MSMRNKSNQLKNLVVTDALIYDYDKEHDALIMQHANNCDLLSKEDATEMIDLLKNYIKYYNVYAQMQTEQRKEKESKMRKANAKDEPKRNIKASYIYLMSDDKQIKIGVSNNISDRLAALSIGNPNIQLLYYKKVANAYKVEKYLHEKYESKKVSGEWFCLSNKDISDIKKYLNKLSSKVGE